MIIKEPDANWVLVVVEIPTIVVEISTTTKTRFVLNPLCINICRNILSQMARISKNEASKKRKDAKDLFMKGFTLDDIAEIIEMSVITVRKWYAADRWESEKQSNIISLSEIRNTILISFNEIKQGLKPTIDAKTAMQYANAFEKLSDKKKMLSYMFESFELMTNELLIDIEKAKSNDRQKCLDILKIVREKMDIVIQKTKQEVLGND